MLPGEYRAFTFNMESYSEPLPFIFKVLHPRKRYKWLLCPVTQPVLLSIHEALTGLRRKKKKKSKLKSLKVKQEMNNKNTTK